MIWKAKTSFVLILGSCVSCYDVPSSYVATRADANINNSETRHVNESRNRANAQIVSEKEHIGCWSSYNGTLLEMTQEVIKISKDKFRPVRYKVIDLSVSEGKMLIQLVDRPQFHYFQEFLSFHFGFNKYQDRELSIYDSKTIENLDTSSQASAWVKSDCAQLFPKKDR